MTILMPDQDAPPTHCGAPISRLCTDHIGRDFEESYVCTEAVNHRGRHYGCRVLRDGSLDTVPTFGWPRAESERVA